MTSFAGMIEASRPAIAAYPPGATLGPRVQRSFEFVWLLAGDAHWSWLDRGERLRLTPGCVLLTRPGMQEKYGWGHDQPTRHGYVHFAITERPDAENWPLLRPVVSPGPIGGLLDYLLWLSEDPHDSVLLHVENTIATLLSVFVSGPLPDGSVALEPPALTAVLDHVREEWSQGLRPIPLGELAQAGAVSKEHVARMFRHRYGVGPVAALELVRLDRAATLLARSNYSVTAIAHSCGYPDPLHFSRRFRRVYGASPRAYRTDDTRPSPLAAAGLLPLARRLSAYRPHTGR